MKVFKILSIIICLLICILGIGILGFSYYINDKTQDSIIGENHKSEIRIKEKSKSDEKEFIPDAETPIGVLLIGTDNGQGRYIEEGARSDTLIYLTVNPLTKTTKMYSISRDIYTKVDDNNYQKINAAYSLNKEIGSVKAVEYLLNAPIDYYVSVNMDAVVKAVDTLGGIEVENKLDFPISIEDTEPQYKDVINPGVQYINGSQALVYSRMRKQDPEGDIGRQKRQQEVIRAVLNKTLTINGFINLDNLFNIVKTDVRTNVEPDNILNLIYSYKNAFERIETTSIIGRGEMIQGSYYMIVGRNNIFDIQQQIRTDLNLSELNEFNLSNDNNMITINDNELNLDASTHYEFNSFRNIN